MSPTSPLKIDRSVKTLRELTLEKMRDAILTAYFQPGQRLVERTLCDQLGVSRTVVREVLRHLEAEGLVESIPHQGPIVAKLDADRAAQIYEIRSLLESNAAKACAEQADERVIAQLAAAVDAIEAAFARDDVRRVLAKTTEFYEAMFAGSGKSMAWEIVQSLNARINRLRAMTIGSSGRGREAVAEMRLLLDAIRRRDPAAAYAASAAHIERVAEIAARQLATMKAEQAEQSADERETA